MNIGKEVKEKLGKHLIPLGFKYTAQSPIWIFKRNITVDDETFSQSVYVQKFKMMDQNTLGLRYETSVYGQIPSRNLLSFAPWYSKEDFPFVGYDNDDELKFLIDEFEKIIEQHVIELLNKTSVPTIKKSDRLNKDDKRYLYDNLEKLSDEFKEKYSLSYQISDTDLIEFIFKLVYTDVTRTYLEKKADIMGLGAFMGARLLRQYDGEWMFDEKFNYPFVKFKKGVQPMESSPLGRSFLFFERAAEPDRTAESVKEIISNSIYRCY